MTPNSNIKILKWLRGRLLPLSLTGGGLVIVIVSLLIWRSIVISRIPFESFAIPSLGMDEKLDVPQRPGVRGIIISGPAIKPLYFQLDLSRTGVRELDWRTLMRTDPHADIKVSCRIDEKGRIHFTESDVLMGGHTEVGMMIQRVLKTWSYTPYMAGRIRFWFNLPSKGKKLLIDTESLRRRRDIAPHIPIYNGQLHLIRGISTAEIRIGPFN